MGFDLPPSLPRGRRMPKLLNDSFLPLQHSDSATETSMSKISSVHDNLKGHRRRHTTHTIPTLQSTVPNDKNGTSKKMTETVEKENRNRQTMLIPTPQVPVLSEQLGTSKKMATASIGQRHHRRSHTILVVTRRATAPSEKHGASRKNAHHRRRNTIQIPRYISIPSSSDEQDCASCISGGSLWFDLDDDLELINEKRFCNSFGAISEDSPPRHPLHVQDRSSRNECIDALATAEMLAVDMLCNTETLRDLCRNEISSAPRLVVRSFSHTLGSSCHPLNLKLGITLSQQRMTQEPETITHVRRHTIAIPRDLHDICPRIPLRRQSMAPMGTDDNADA